jgi:hypothetical protein
MMKPPRFFLLLGLVTVLCVLSFELASVFIPMVRPYFWFTVHALLLFVWISLALYVLGRYTAKSRNRQLFSGVISGSVVGKMVLSLIFLGVYRHHASLTGNTYVLLFLLVYGVFTGFEVYFMTRLGAEPFQLDSKGNPNEAPR